ncbi:fatty acid desaturase [Sphingomonas sp. RB3P16]|uniref:fatty acid desaturase n=1 Tax=Parasphingomonas frigoris TaxID=3096163 RepID=UPI002FCAB27E
MAKPFAADDSGLRRSPAWPTLAVTLAVYSGWLALTFWHGALPLPLLAVLGGWTLAWHGSLQHETIHGHPTGVAPLDHAIGFVPLSLWLPYALYRRSHVAHHASPAITDPLLDPESRYVDRDHGLAWLAARVQTTLVGHMLLGPPITILRFLFAEARRAGTEPLVVLRDWAPHLAAVALVVAWLDHVGLDLATYALCFVYPGMALTALRGHAEHQAETTTPGRAATVEQGGVFGLLFLNNNLHAAHHERPGLAWYHLPAYHRRNRARLIDQGAILYDGYGDVVRRFAVRGHDQPLHPAHREPA